MNTKYSRICPRCNKVITYVRYKTHNQAIHRNSVCRSCRTSIANLSPKGILSYPTILLGKGVYAIPYSWFSKSIFKEEKNKRTGNITIEQVYEMYLKQNKKCALSGLNIGFLDSGKSGSTCSIDRIDSSKEYVLDNIQLVHLKM